jgi:hypothetical protein
MGSPECLLGSDRLEYEEMGRDFRNLMGKTERYPLIPSIRKKESMKTPPT